MNLAQYELNEQTGILALLTVLLCGLHWKCVEIFNTLKLLNGHYQYELWIVTNLVKFDSELVHLEAKMDKVPCHI